MELIDKIGQFFESWQFFGEAAITGTLAGALLGALGAYILLGRIVFLSAALGQVSGFGVALAVWLSGLMGVVHSGHEARIIPAVFSTAFTLLVLGGLSPVLRKSKNPDAVLAVLYLSGAAGTILLGTKIIGEIQDIQQLLSGNAVLVDHGDYILLIVLSAVVISLLFWGQRAFSAAWFWPDSARVRKIPVTFLRLLIYLIMVVVIACCTRVMGAMPVFAMSCLPALCVRRLPSFRSLFCGAMIVGSAIGFGGYLLAFINEWPVGPTQTVLAVTVVVVCEFVGICAKQIKGKCHA